VICTTTFEGMARRAAQALGMATLPLVVVQHPLGGLQADEIMGRVREASERLGRLVGRAGEPGR
jgi:hypothetical protein